MATKAPPITQPTGDYSHAIQSTPPKISFQLDSVPPNQFLYLQLNDYIGFTIYTNASPITVQLTYRYLTPEGEVKQGTSIFNTVGTINTFNFTIGEGWLISFGLVRTSGGNSSVISFAQALVIRDQFTGAGQNIYGVIWQGFFNAVTGNGWPLTPGKEIGDGPGVIRSIVGSVPAAGADISETVPVFHRWILLNIQAALTTGAAVANRSPLWLIDDGSNQIFRSVSFQAQVASTVIRYQAFNNLQTAAAINGSFPLNMPIPQPVRGGYHIQTSTVNIQAADQWTAPIYQFLEWGSWDS
jgi:hypothetical protein